mgnify:CR=1 FL=1
MCAYAEDEDSCALLLAMHGDGASTLERHTVMRGAEWSAGRLAQEGAPARVYVADAASHQVRRAARGQPAGHGARAAVHLGAAADLILQAVRELWQSGSSGHSPGAWPSSARRPLLRARRRRPRARAPHAAAALTPPSRVAQGVVPRDCALLHQEARMGSFLAVAIGPAGDPYGALLLGRHQAHGFDDAW